MTRKIEVDLVANTRPFNNAMDAAIGKVTGFKSRVTAMGGGSLGKGLAIGAGVASFNLLTSAIGTAVGKMDEMHQAFLDDQASQERLRVVIRNTTKDYQAATKAAEDYAEAQIDLGFADDEVRDSIGQLIGQTHDMTEAIRLAGLAQDIARAKNIDLATATDAVTKAYNGQGRALAAIGIDIKGAVGGAQLLDRALKNVKGSAIAYANTGAGRLERANKKLGETFEKLGGVIDVVSQAVIPILVDGFAEIVGIIGDTIGLIRSAIDGFGLLNDAIGRFGEGKLGGLIAVKDLLGTIVAALPGANVLGLPTNQGGGVTSTTTGVTSQGGITVHRGINIGVPGSVGGPFHSGGVVGGPPGSDQLIMAQAGERIVPTGQAAAGQTIIVNIASFIGSDRDIDRFSDRLAFRLRSTSLS